LFVPIGLNLAFILSLPLLALISGCKSIFQLLRRSIPQTQ
jgi:hypothetical protein